MKKNRVGIATSIKSGIDTPLARRTNVEIGASRKSTEPTKTFVPSAFGGIFLMKAELIFREKHFPQNKNLRTTRFTLARDSIVDKLVAVSSVSLIRDFN